MHTMKFEVEVGLLVRNAVKDEINHYCFGNNIEVSIQEVGGLLVSVLMVKMTHPNIETLNDAKSYFLMMNT